MKKPRKPRPRAIPQQYPTGATEREATAGDEFVADVDGAQLPDGTIDFATAHWVIRKGQDGEIIDRAPGATRSEVYERVALLNRGPPTVADNRSWGKLKKQGARSGKGVDVVTKLFERLIATPRTTRVLRAYRAKGRVLHRVVLAGLLRRIATADLDLGDDEDKLLDALSRQLSVKLEIQRSGSEYQ